MCYDFSTRLSPFIALLFHFLYLPVFRSVVHSIGNKIGQKYAPHGMVFTQLNITEIKAQALIHRDNHNLIERNISPLGAVYLLVEYIDWFVYWFEYIEIVTCFAHWQLLQHFWIGFRVGKCRCLIQISFRCISIRSLHETVTKKLFPNFKDISSQLSKWLVMDNFFRILGSLCPIKDSPNF